MSDTKKPEAVTDEELHAAVDAHLAAGGTVVLEQPRDGAAPIEHPALEAAAENAEFPPGITLRVVAACGTCQTAVTLELPDGAHHRHWLDNDVTDHIAQAMHAAGCRHF